MVVFALLMVAAAVYMIRSRQAATNRNGTVTPLKLVLYGILIGLVTGFLGAGGGFLLIPALVVLMKLPMNKAIGTSLLIIALNSRIGVAGGLGRNVLDVQL